MQVLRTPCLPLLRRARDRQANAISVLQAVVFVALIWAIQQAISYSNQSFGALQEVTRPSATDVAQIPDCTRNIYLTVSARSSCLAVAEARTHA
jgi:hypothetical protein